MADIPLRTYVEQIDGLVDKKQVDEAIAHCKHILTYYPKHLGTYQALGKALLEKGRHADAADIFNRVLSAVPDDYLSHIGMSIVCEDQGNLEGALQHMERAYEVMPSNPAIQDELRRLYGRRDGLMPPRTRLTRGALARMYARGGLFAQAEAELKKALSDDPNRLDLSTVLAQVYWQTNRRQEAADVCAGLVEQLPYNQEANRMLADILLAQGRTAELVPYRQRLEALDPYAAYAEPGADGHGPEPKAESILIPRLDYTPDMAASAASTPEWVTSIGATMEQPGRGAAPATPDWLPKTAPSEAEVTQAAELPDWLKGAQVAVASSPAEGLGAATALPSAEGEMPDWMKATVTTPLDMPDWMKTAPAAEETPAAPADESADWAAVTIPATQVPDWMKDMVPEATPKPPSAGGAAALEFNAPAVPAAPAEPEAMNPDEALHWLEGLALQQGARPEEMVTQLKAPAAPAAEEVPDWLTTAEAAPAQEVPDWLTTAEAAPAEDVPDWLKTAVKAPPAAAAPSAPAAEAAPDWLKTAEAAPEAQASAEAIPDWLKEAAPAAAAPTPEADAMNDEDALRWLEGLALQQGAKPEEMVSQPPAKATAEALAPAVAAAEEVPSWLRAAEAPAEELPAWLQAQPAAPAAAPAAELPDWLKPAEVAAPAEELPDWLKGQVQEEAAPAAAAELPEWLSAQMPAAAAPVEPAAGPAAAPPAEAEKPDWLKQMEAEADAYEASLAPAAPAAAAPAQPMAAPAEEEKPDWLKQMEAEADAYEASLAPAQPAPPVEAAPPAKPKLRPEELPDFLQLASAAAVERAEQPTHLAEELEAEQAAVVEEPPLAAADIPDWLKAFGEAPAEPEPAPQPAESIQWLESTPPAPTLTPADIAATAEPTEELPGWTQRPTAKAGTTPTEVPSWAQELPPGPTDTVSLWLAQKKVPEWLRKPEEEAPAEPAAPAPEPVEAAAAQPPAPAAAEAEVVMEDDALRWLEDLAAQQGARPEELITKPEERLAQPPAWVSPETAAPLAAEAQPVPKPAAPPPPPAGIEEMITKPLDQLPAWLTLDILETPPAEPLAPAPAPAEEAPTPPAPPAPAEPAAMGADEALRWLENLAVQQGARPEELITKPEERLAQPPAWVSAEKAVAAEIPAAMPAEPPAAEAAPVEPPPEEAPIPAATIEEFVTQPLGKLPEWLTLETPEAGVATAAPVAPPEPIAEAPAPAAAEAAMSADEALRWLEGLAAQQGARPEELITRPEERLAAPPAWVAAEQAAAPAKAAVEPPQPVAEAPAVPEPPAEIVAEAPTVVAEAAVPAAMSDDEALRWLESLAVKQGARPEELVTKPEERLEQPPAWVAAETAAAAVAQPQPVAEVPPAEPVAEALPVMSDDEALRWLESLAVRQGARPEELVTKPEERLEQPPAWVSAETAAAAEVAAPVTQAEAPEPEIPAIAFARVEPEPAPQPPAEIPAEAAKDDRLSKLAGKLAASRRAREAEIETRFATQRAEQEAARRAVQQKLERKPAAPEPKPAVVEPPAAAPAAPVAPAEAPAPVAAAAAAMAQPKPAAKPKALAGPRPKKIKRGKSPYAAEAPENLLALARQRLAEGDSEGAAEILDYLVATNQMLPYIINELEPYTARQFSAPLLQVLGDAYMKTNQLQKALDSYRQALGHL